MTGHHCGQPRPEAHETGSLWRCDYCGVLWRLTPGRPFWTRVRAWDFASLVRLRRQEYLDRARAAAGWDVRPPFWADPTGGVES